MEPEIVFRDAFTVMGVMERFTDDDHQNYEAIWKRYMAHHDEIKARSTDGAHYGLSWDDDGLDYFAGMAVEDVEGAPEELTVREVPAGHYAVFECTVETIHDAYAYILNRWLGTTPHRTDESRPAFERYPPNTESGAAPVFIYWPVKELS